MPRVKRISDEEVLDLALAVLLDRGPHRFTLPEVGDAVGLSPSTLIQRFGSKRELLHRVLDRSTARLRQQLVARPSTGDHRSDLIEWLVELTKPLRTRSHIASNLTLLIEDIREGPRRLAAQQHMSVIREGIAAYLTPLKSPSLDAHVALIEAQWNGLVIQWALHDTTDDIDNWLRRGLGDLLQVLLPHEATDATSRGNAFGPPASG